jgi:CspA family cold shock protein
MTGVIKTLRADKGFGFIKGSDGSQYFFHQSAIYGEGIEMLREGDNVEFELGPEGPRGREPKASSARPPRRSSASN